MQNAYLPETTMHNSYGSNGAESRTSYSAYSASGLEDTVTRAYSISQYAASFSGTECPVSYAGLAAHSSSYWTENSFAAYHAQPVMFLNHDRPRTPFVAAAAEIAEFIREAFAKTTGRELPENITITVAPRNALQASHRLFLKEGIVGLSFNTSSGKEIFAVAGNLDDVMLVIGHELGHVLSPALSNGQAEEAKAFAFEMAWAQAIFLNDIAGLRNSINRAALSMEPAKNGLHDLAFAFVKAATMAGKEALQLHSQLSLRQQEFDITSTDFAITAAANPAVYFPLTSSHSKRRYGSGGYRNKSRVQNVPFFTNFTWTDLGTGIYGMYIPLTASIFMNDRLLRTDMEQFHKTLGHEYILHHVMQLPDNYVTKILEETIFWVKDEEDRYKP